MLLILIGLRACFMETFILLIDLSFQKSGITQSSPHKDACLRQTKERVAFRVVGTREACFQLHLQVESMGRTCSQVGCR